MFAIHPSNLTGHRFSLIVHYVFRLISVYIPALCLFSFSATPGLIAPLFTSTLFPVYYYVASPRCCNPFQPFPYLLFFWLSSFSFYIVTNFSFLLSCFVVSCVSFPDYSFYALLPVSITIYLFLFFLLTLSCLLFTSFLSFWYSCEWRCWFVGVICLSNGWSGQLFEWTLGGQGLLLASYNPSLASIISKGLYPSNLFYCITSFSSVILSFLGFKLLTPPAGEPSVVVGRLCAVPGW